jgi:hypothetical protein
MHLDLENARRAVKQGVLALDRWQAYDEPDWRTRIDLERLDLWSPTDCILGQLFPAFKDDPYAHGLEQIGHADEDGADFGFTHLEVPFSEGGFGMAALTVAWTEAILKKTDVVRMRCSVEVEVELDVKTGNVTPTLCLPPFSDYTQLSGPALSRPDQMRVVDWSEYDLNFESRLRHAVEFTVIGYWSKTGKAVAVPVTTDTPRHAVSLAPAANRSPGQELVPVCVLCDGEMVWSAVEQVQPSVTPLAD